MIEKQYRLNKWGTRLLKNNRPLFDWTNESDEIVDLLNTLNDENEQLKKIRDTAFEFAEKPTQHNLWKFRTFLKEYNGEGKMND